MTIQPVSVPTLIDIFGTSYVLIETDAPLAYDFITIPLTPDVSDTVKTRFALVREDDWITQRSYYRNTLHVGAESNVYSRDTITEQLYARLLKLEVTPPKRTVAIDVDGVEYLFDGNVVARLNNAGVLDEQTLIRYERDWIERGQWPRAALHVRGAP